MVRVIFDFDNTIAQTSFHAIRKLWPSLMCNDFNQKKELLSENANYIYDELVSEIADLSAADYQIASSAARRLTNTTCSVRMAKSINKMLGWNFEPLAKDKEQAGRLLKLFYTPIFYNDLPIGDGTDEDRLNLLELMAYLRSKGCKLTFCSNRRSDAFKLAEDWLLDNGLEFDEMVKVNTFDKGHIFCDNDEVQNIFIDDKPECMEGKHLGKILFGNYLYQEPHEVMNHAVNWDEAIFDIKTVIGI